MVHFIKIKTLFGKGKRSKRIKKFSNIIPNNFNVHIATHLIALVIILMTQHKNEIRFHAFTVFCPLIKAVKDITGPSPTEGEKSANYGRG